MLRGQALSETADPERSDPSRSDPSQSLRCEVPCAHCGLPTPCADGDDPSLVFCCNGCSQAYALIQGWGLEDYYAIRDRFGGASAGATGVLSAADSDRYLPFDDDAYLGPSAPVTQTDGTLSTELSVSGLHCAACSWLIENVAARTPGWLVARVKLNRHTVQLVFDPERIRLSEIAHLIGRLGYELSPLGASSDDRFRKENRRQLTQIAVAGFCAANAMWIAIALYAGEASWVATEHRTFLRLAGSALGIAAVAFPGRTFFTSAFASIRTKTPHMDLPVALGLSVGTVVGAYNALTGQGDVYFDSLAMLVFLLLIGRWIQFRQQHHAARAVDLLLRITPQHARLVDPTEPDREGRWVMVDTLAPGQLVRVNAGESIPVDGRVTEGQTMVDRSLLTGESTPIDAAVGDEVTAGTINLSRPVTICVEAIGDKSRIGKVMQSVEDAMAKRTPIVQLADRIGGVFVVAVTVLAAIAFLIWIPSGLDIATANATSLLIVACPCALALATPLAIAVSLGRAAKRRILIRDGAVFQQLATPGSVWFDKTGTLTEGRPRATLVHGSAEALRMAASVERAFCHPIADAIVRACESQGLPIEDDVEEVELKQGGVTGIVCGLRVDVGNESMMRTNAFALGTDITRSIQSCLDQRMTPVIVAIDSVAVAVLAVSDRTKPDAHDTVSRVHRAGWKVGILSGDHREIVADVGQQLDIPSDRTFGNLLPEDKLSRVTTTHESGTPETVIMVGDGANDAAALAAADVGIAVRGGAEVSLQAAPVFIASGSLTSIADLFGAAKRTNQLIRTTFAVSLTYNAVAVALAFSGWISPLAAALLMPISSVSVLSLTLAWPTFRDSNP